MDLVEFDSIRHVTLLTLESPTLGCKIDRMDDPLHGTQRLVQATVFPLQRFEVTQSQLAEFHFLSIDVNNVTATVHNASSHENLPPVLVLRLPLKKRGEGKGSA